MPTPPRILAFSGSARRESLNKKLLAVAIEATRAVGAEVTLFDFRESPIPLYDGDLEDSEGIPPNAQKLIDLITQHSGLLIASPEYNSQITPLLKNAIDWCTRAEENPLKGKVAGIVSASPGMFGGIRSQTLLRQLLTHLGCHVVPVTCVLPKADEAFDEHGTLKQERIRKNVQMLADELVRITSLLARDQ